MEIIPFIYGGTEVRMILDESGNPWWVAKDVCNCLELENVTRAVSDLDKEDLTLLTVRSDKQNREMNCVNESGLYQLIFKSRKESAKRFKKWITSEVLPSIRKTGSYSLDNEITQLDDRDLVAFYSHYEVMNQNQEFYIEFQRVKVKAYADVNHGFLISTGELARIMGVSASTLRVLKKYHHSKFKGGIHHVELGKTHWWTRKGAGWISLHNRDGSFGRYLLSGALDKQLDSNAEILTLDNESLLKRFDEQESEEVA